MDTGSREENASNQNHRVPRLMESEAKKALGFGGRLRARVIPRWRGNLFLSIRS
jgi:hypothetical protein